MANWGAIFAGFSPETQAQLLPHAQAYDQCMREWDAKRRFFQKQAYQTSALPLAISPWSGRSPLDPGLRNLGVAWYVPRRQTMRAYGRELAIARSTGLPAARTAAQQTGVARELTLATLPASTLALVPAVCCGGTRHAAGTRHRASTEGVRRITEEWTRAGPFCRSTPHPP